MWKKMQTNCIFITSNFVIHSQILIFLVFKIASCFPHWLQVTFFMTLFFYLFTFAINLWHRKFVTADVTAVFVNNQHGIQWREQDFDKNTQIHSAYTVTRAEELKSVHLKCNLFAFSSISGIIAKYLQKDWIFNFSRYCSNIPEVRWAMSYGFCSKFHTLSAMQKNENRLRCDKVTESLTVGTFLRHSVVALKSLRRYGDTATMN